MATLKYAVGSTDDLMSGADINSLGVGESRVSSVEGASGVFTNVAGTGLDGYPYGYLTLLLKAGASQWRPTGCVKLWFLRRGDGTNYESHSTAEAVSRAADVLFYPRGEAADQYLIGVRGDRPGDSREPWIPLPVGNFKVLICNAGLGQSLAGSGNKITVLPFTETTV